MIQILIDGNINIDALCLGNIEICHHHLQVIMTKQTLVTEILLKFLFNHRVIAFLLNHLQTDW
jgi:hypothetical protein